MIVAWLAIPACRGRRAARGLALHGLQIWLVSFRVVYRSRHPIQGRGMHAVDYGAMPYASSSMVLFVYQRSQYVITGGIPLRGKAVLVIVAFIVACTVLGIRHRSVV